MFFIKEKLLARILLEMSSDSSYIYKNDIIRNSYKKIKILMKQEII